MFPPARLDKNQIQLCSNTISTNSFYMMVADALESSKELSVVRMGDGEVQLMKACATGDLAQPIDSHPEDWLKRLGCLGITKRELLFRLLQAANLSTYFAPSVSGISMPGFHLHSLFEPRSRYVDNFFVNAWTEEMKIGLFKQAGHVLFIHRNLGSADAMQIRAKYGLGVRVTYLNLNSWEQADEVIRKANKIDASLVLFSAGPASKYIGPRITSGGNIPKVTLDLGNAADGWLLNSLKDAAQGRR
jgi:hypothetical protein